MSFEGFGVVCVMCWIWSVSGGCRVMDLGWCVSCEGFGVSQDLEVVCQEDVI